MVAVRRSQIAGPIALRRLDFGDLGTVAGEQHGAVWRGDALPEVDDTQAAIRRLVRRRQLFWDCHLFSLDRWKQFGREKRMGTGKSRIGRFGPMTVPVVFGGQNAGGLYLAERTLRLASRSRISEGYDRCRNRLLARDALRLHPRFRSLLRLGNAGGFYS